MLEHKGKHFHMDLIQMKKVGINDNQEDSLIFNQSAIDRGIFRVDSMKKYHSEIQKNHQHHKMIFL